MQCRPDDVQLDMGLTLVGRTGREIRVEIYQLCNDVQFSPLLLIIQLFGE